ncbi:MAG: preprotein translocase subunit YajC [Deltaproteobacteria bacterium]|nr:MAG: preprotein translocase subunit YajC [Deltaproteobacteria bacterium]
MSLENLFIGTAHAQATTTTSTVTGAQPASPASSLQMFLPMILVFVIFYFLLIRPQSKQRKQHQDLLNTLKKGDEVVTAGGIHGKVHGVADNIVTLEIADNVRVKMDKQQITSVKTLAA